MLVYRLMLPLSLLGLAALLAIVGVFASPAWALVGGGIALTLVGIWLAAIARIGRARRRLEAATGESTPGDDLHRIDVAYTNVVAKLAAQAAALDTWQTRFALLNEGASDVLWEWDVAQNRWSVSPRWQEELGFPRMPVQASFDAWLAGLHPSDASQLKFRLEEFAREPQAMLVYEFRARRENGEYSWMQMRASAQRDDQGVAQKLAGSFTDIGERKRQEAALHYQAMHDPLTRLPNRALAQDRLAQGLRGAQRQHRPIALALLDIDDFRAINERLGFAVGDAVLQETARRLQRTVRSSDTVARFGGDEFLVLLPHVDEVRALLVAQKLLRALEPTITAAGQRLHVQASVGLALYPEHGIDAQQLIANVTAALGKAQSGGLGFCLFEGDNPPLPGIDPPPKLL